MNNQTTGALMIMAAGFCWGTTGIFSKYAYAETNIGPISLAWFRLIIGVPLLGLVAIAKGYPFSLTRREIALFVAFGFCGLTVFEALYFTSFAFTSVQHATSLLYTAPAFVAVLSWVILKEKLTRRKLVAVALSITGAFLILGLVRGEPLFTSRTQIGDGLAILSGLAYSSWYIFGKVLGKGREPAVTSVFAMCFGAVFLFPLAVAIEGFRIPMGWFAWELVVGVGIIPTAMAYIFYLGGLKLIDATKASVYAITEPLSAALLAFLFLGESLSYDSAIGFLMIVSSILLISKS
jgi:DME family drug/metabolite transporter